MKTAGRVVQQESADPATRLSRGSEHYDSHGELETADSHLAVNLMPDARPRSPW